MATKSHRSILALSSIGIDIDEDVFHLVGFDSNGEIVLRRKVKRLSFSSPAPQMALAGRRYRAEPDSVRRFSRSVPSAASSSPP